MWILFEGIFAHVQPESAQITSHWWKSTQRAAQEKWWNEVLMWHLQKWIREESRIDVSILMGALQPKMQNQNKYFIFYICSRHIRMHNETIKMAVKSENGSDRIMLRNFNWKLNKNLFVPFSSTMGASEKRKRVCEFCSKEFTRTYNLNQHRMIHTGEHRYSCDMCHKKYKSKRNLK